MNGCHWPDGPPCSEPVHWLYPVPVCVSHGREIQQGAELIRYRALLRSKLAPQTLSGLTVNDLHSGLMEFQAAAVRWALKRGSAALWLATGLGKTYCELAFGYHVGGTVLLFAPIAVGGQMLRMATEWPFQGQIRQIKEPSDLAPGINITNYQRAERFADVANRLSAVVLDESSILKAEAGVTRKILTEAFAEVRFKLAASATPAPNDVVELANHCEFLGVMKRQEMLATFFVHDEHGWRLRGHAREPFYRWLASWALVANSPADLGFEHEAARFVLPALHIRDAIVKTNWRREGELFPGYGLKGITDRTSVRRISLNDRGMRAAQIIAETPGQFVVFCGLNDEQTKLAKYLGKDCVSIQGKDDEQSRSFWFDSWRLGQVRTLLCKPSMFGHGLNMQCCHNIIFLGLSDSFEQYYQAIRRCWRYQQEHEVNVWIVVSDHEQAIVRNVRAKESEWIETTQRMVAAMVDYERTELNGTQQAESFDDIEKREGQGWTLYRGDCMETMMQMPDNSIDLTVSSPPFLSLYTYSASEKDIGNSKSPEQFLEQYLFIARQLKRITKPGRIAAIHCQQVATTLVNHGYIGLQDFRGMLIRAHQGVGWDYHGEVLIDKNPQAQAIRAHVKGLAFIQKSKDQSWLRPALCDYILLFRKRGDNAVPILTDVSNDEWIKLAHGAWYEIRENDTLNTLEAKEDDDERHIVPLQRKTIQNCIRLWSNRGEVVFDPFAGIGSTLYVAMQEGRRGLGCELKPRYFETAVKNCERALAMRKQGELFA